MIPPYTYAAARLAEERMKDTMRHGEHARLIRMGKPARCGPADRALARIGDLLVAGGRMLQERYRPSPTRLKDPALRLSR